MVRRHRISEEEFGPVLRAIYFKLDHDSKEELSEDSKHLFRVLWRFHKPRQGPPAYPEFNEDNLEHLLYMVTPMLR